MKHVLVFVCTVALATSAAAAPNVTNATQKGSLLIFPDIRVDLAVPNQYNTMVRIQNDGSSDVSVKCYWMDGFKNRVDFTFTVTRNQAVWFDARTGAGSTGVNPFPSGPANGFTNTNRHPFLGGRTTVPLGANVGWNTSAQPGFGRYDRGLLACWAVDAGETNQVKWNHLSGTATVYAPGAPGYGAYEYNAYTFFVPTGIDLQPIGTAGVLNLNGVEYDSCPLYQIGQFSPGLRGGAPAPNTPLPYFGTRLAIVGCNLNLNQDWTPVWTKLQFDVWNEDEVKFTGAFECADSWHEVLFENEGSTGQTSNATNPPTTVGPGFVDGIDAAQSNFYLTTLATYGVRYRIQGIKSAQCERTKPSSGAGSDVASVTTQAVGIIAVQSSDVGDVFSLIGSSIAAAGKMSGAIRWDPAGVVPEGSIDR